MKREAINARKKDLALCQERERERARGGFERADGKF